VKLNKCSIALSNKVTFQQDRKCTSYNVTLRGVGATKVKVISQEIVHILSVYL